MLVRDIVRNEIAYDAKKWLSALQKTLEKKACCKIRFTSTQGRDEIGYCVSQFLQILSCLIIHLLYI